MRFTGFIKRNVLFLLPILVIWLGVELYLSNKPLQNTYTAKAHYLQLKKDSVTTLILGSSHILNAFNPNYLSTISFNLANASQTLYYDSALLKTYLPQLPKLKTVIIGISYFSFFYELQDISENWRQQIYYHAFGIKPAEFHAFELNNYSKLSLYGFGKTFTLLKQKGLSTDCSNLQPNGFLFKNVNETINDSIGEKRVTIHNNQRFAYRQQNIQDRLLHMVRLLREKDIQVVFVTTPCHKSYWKFCKEEVLQSQQKFLHNLCQQFSCKYYNFLKDERFVLEDFANVDHLNLKGSIKFSTLLNDSLTVTSTTKNLPLAFSHKAVPKQSF